MKDTLALVHELTRDHKTTIEHDDGTRSYVDELSLLAQLHDAITGKSAGGGGSSTRQRSPISTKAFDLWQEIAHTTLEYWPGYGRPHLARTPLPQRIQQWAAVAVNSNDPEDDKNLKKYVRRWINEIQGLFEPSIDLAAPCPECHESFLWRYDGVDNVKKRTLTYNKHRATCINCGTTWEGKASMTNLSKILHDGQPINGSPTHTTQTGA